MTADHLTLHARIVRQLDQIEQSLKTEPNHPERIHLKRKYIELDDYRISLEAEMEGIAA